MSSDTSTTERPDFTRLVDLASRRMGSGVVAANDELFAERENLIKPEPATYQVYTFGHKGQVYDGWETRRRREPGQDWAVVRLGVPGIVRGVVVDTAFFKGNYPPAVSVEATAVEGYPSPEQLSEVTWETLVDVSPAVGDAENFYAVDDDRRWTHVRLTMHPDGGVARFRVHGTVVPDPRFLSAGSVDLAALENGADVTGCSNMFYSSPVALISPGEARVMGEGWETARRRDDSNDWVELALAGPGRVQVAELDTRYFVGNAPGWARLTGVDARSVDLDAGRDPQGQGGSLPDGWVELLPRTALQPDTRHRFLLDNASEVTHVRLDVYPDGGMARVRLWGDLASEGRDALTERWRGSLPEAHARSLDV